jgi:hypothetical protein
LPDKAPPYTAQVLVPVALAAINARLGRFEDADELMRLTQATSRHEDLYSQVYLRRMGAAVAFERGDRVGALADLSYASRMYERGGSVVAAWLVDAWIGRTLLLLGRRTEGHRMLDRTSERAAAGGAISVVRAADRSRQFDPLIQLKDADLNVSSPKHGESTRALALSALRTAAAGDVDQARTLARELESHATGPGYALDRALMHVTFATLARLAGKAREAASELERAAQEAATDGADPDLVNAIYEQVGSLRVVTAGRRAASVRPPDLESFEIVLDGRNHELRIKRRIVSFQRRPMLRRLLYALASRPNEVFSKETLAGHLWSSRYNPLTHDNALWVSLRRLRVLLKNTGLTIELEEDGYRLIVPEGFIYVDPGEARATS